MWNRMLQHTLIAALPIVLLGCASTQPNQALEQARIAVRAAANDPTVLEAAPVELKRAQDTLAEADALYEDSGNKERSEVEHSAYLASRYAEIAVSRAARHEAHAEVAAAESQRNDILLQARTSEAERAEARARAAAAAARSLEQQLAELEAQRTERGLVLTLGDVLFDTNRAELKVGAESTLERLAQFMREYPERNVLIEGHTDSRGTEQYNQALSARRASAVQNALLARGIGAERIQTRGIGESTPVASNETAAGRQENRRVEVVISDAEGRISSLSAAR